ncbi:MAG: methyl-accepting chemotaxis protein [Thermoleophilia bacterium]
MRLPLPRSLRAKLICAVGALVIAALAVMTFAAITRSGSTNRAAVEREAANLARAQASELAQDVRGGLATATGIASFAGAYEGDDRRVVLSGLRATAAADPSLFGVWIVYRAGRAPGADAANAGGPGADAEGRFSPYFARSGGKLGLEQTDDVSAEWGEDYFRASAESGRPEVIEPYLDESVDTVMTSFTAPVRRGGRLLGVAGVDVSLADLSAAVARAHVLDSGYALVVSRGGLVLAGPKSVKPGTGTLAGLKGVDPRLVAMVREVAGDGAARHTTAKDPVRGRDAVVFAAPVGDSGWTYLLVAPRDEILAPTASLRTTLLLLAVGAAAVIALGVLLLVTRLLRPLRGLREAATRIATGDTEAPLPAAGRDEVGEVVAAFEHLAGYLRDHADVARRVADGDLTVEPAVRSDRDVLGQSLRDMVGDLRGLVGDLAESAEAVAGTAGRVDAGVRESRRALAEIDAAVEQVSGGAERQRELVAATTDAVRSTGATAADADASASEGLAFAERTREVMLGIAAASAQAAAAIGELEARSADIAGIVGEVDAIAEQTRMLALNAAIEAARAGDAGRGFAVVADQVGELAGQAQAAAARIGELVAGTRHEVARAVEIVGEGARSSESGAEVLEGSLGAFSRIRETVAEVAGQVGALEEISQQVAMVAETAVHASSGASTSAGSAAESSEEIDRAVAELGRHAARLADSVARFRLRG